jgi:hypothetical protein
MDLECEAVLKRCEYVVPNRGEPRHDAKQRMPIGDVTVGG